MRKTWIVDRARDVDIIEADQYAIDMSGALVFSNGDLISRELVIAIAPAEWLTVVPYNPDDDDEDDE